MTEEIIIDAENAVLGRLASYSAKKSLEGKEIKILNCEKAIILGREHNILARYAKKKSRGGYGKGPIIPTTSERIVKRTIRNMLPYKQERGRTALKRIKCYKGIPKEFEGKKIIKSSGKRTGMSLKKLEKMLRGKYEQ